MSSHLAPANASPYQDRVIPTLTEADTQELTENRYDSTGLRRGYSLEALWNQQNTQQGKSTVQGLQASAYIDTLLYGSLSGQWSLQADSNSEARASSFVLRQIGLPFDGGWRVDNALGMINLPVPEMARSSPRLALPTPAIRGLSTSWQQNRDLNITATWGQAGRFSGFQLPSFNVTPGKYSSLGIQKQMPTTDGLWQWSTALAQANEVTSVFAPTSTGQGSVDAQALYLSGRREWGSNTPGFLQVSAVQSANNGSTLAGAANPSAGGVWADGGWTQAAHQYAGGVFWLAPGLGWLDSALANDVYGAYGRHIWRTRQWSVESTLELLGSVSGDTQQGFFASNSTRYQYSTTTSFGGTVNIRRFGLQAQSLLVYTQFTNNWGNTRLQAEVSSANTGEKQLAVQADQEWGFVSTMRLSTSLSAERKSSLTGASRASGAAVTADWPISPRLSLTSSVQSRWATGSTQYTVNSGLTWQIAPAWSLQATVYAIDGQASPPTSLAVSPLTLPSTPETRSRDRGVYVSLRYQERAGSARAPVGGSVGSAAGQLAGTVFLDANKNGKRDASERGAANVAVLLDGRYTAQTDAQGRFDFAYVTAGVHTITVISDNLPLPWVLENNGQQKVQVSTRASSFVNIGATNP